MMRIGIFGAGKIGGTLGRLWHQAGHEIYFGTRHPENLSRLVSELGSRCSAGSVKEAARFAHAILLAVPLKATPAIALEVAEDLKGKLILDATNPYPGRDGKLAEQAVEKGRGSAEWTAMHFHSSIIVKAFNTVYFKTLQTEAHGEGERIGIPIAGDDQAGLESASILVREAGFEPVVVGPLSASAKFEVGTPVYNTGMRHDELVHYFALRE